MKKLLIFLTLVSSSLAIFQDLKYLGKNSKYNKKEPPLRPVKPVTAVDNVYEAWIRQRLDNFDPQRREFFHMRYMYNKENFKPGGPIFIFVGGEWTISSGMLRFGHMYDMAKALNGLLFYTEHRFYGETRPTEDLSLENLRFLNIDQALADLAHFITFAKESFPGAQDSGVILVGCSYSATMVTWFQQKYPHLSNGAWALSGPLHAKVDFVEYMEVVSRAIHEVGGEKCSSRIKRAFEQLDYFVEQGNATELTRIFKLCSPLDLNNQIDIWSLFGDVGGAWSGYVQYYYRHDRDIEKPCEKLVEIDAATDAEAYGQWVLNRWGIGENRCFDHKYESFIQSWGGTGWDDYVAYVQWRQWFYQTCAEYGWYQSSGSDDILFGSNFPVNISIQICNDLYKNTFPMTTIESNVERTNIIYGSRNPSVRNVYSTHGEYDPWAPMGVDQDINEDSPTVILPGESHCSDTSSISSRDTPETINSKEKIFMLAQKWLNIPEEDWIKLPIN